MYRGVCVCNKLSSNCQLGQIFWRDGHTEVVGVRFYPPVLLQHSLCTARVVPCARRRHPMAMNGEERWNGAEAAAAEAWAAVKSVVAAEGEATAVKQRRDARNATAATRAPDPHQMGRETPEPYAMVREAVHVVRASGGTGPLPVTVLSGFLGSGKTVPYA